MFYFTLQFVPVQFVISETIQNTSYLDVLQLDENYKMHGVRLNVVCPGTTDTPFLNQIYNAYHVQDLEELIKPGANKLT